MHLHTIVNASTLLLSSKYYSNQLKNIQRYPNQKRKGPKSIQIEDAVDDGSAVNLAHNYSATWDPSLSQTQNHQGNNCNRWLPVFVILVIITMLELASTKHAHAHTHKEIIKIASSTLNILGNAWRGVL